MTGRGLASAFRFVRSFALAVFAVVLADGHPAVIVLAVLAFVLLAWTEVSRHRGGQSGDSDGDASERSAWWLGIVIPFGLGVWATFLYLGVRTRRRGWLVWSLIYLSMIVLGGYLNVLGGDEDPTLSAIASALWLVAWGAGALHAYLVRDQVRIQLARAKSRGASVSTPSVPSAR